MRRCLVTCDIDQWPEMFLEICVTIGYNGTWNWLTGDVCVCVCVCVSVSVSVGVCGVGVDVGGCGITVLGTGDMAFFSVR